MGNDIIGAMGGAFVIIMYFASAIALSAITVGINFILNRRERGICEQAKSFFITNIVFISIFSIYGVFAPGNVILGIFLFILYVGTMFAIVLYKGREFYFNYIINFLCQFVTVVITIIMVSSGDMYRVGVVAFNLPVLYLIIVSVFYILANIAIYFIKGKNNVISEMEGGNFNFNRQNQMRNRGGMSYGHPNQMRNNQGNMGYGHPNQMRNNQGNIGYGHPNQMGNNQGNMGYGHPNQMRNNQGDINYNNSNQRVNNQENLNVDNQNKPEDNKGQEDNSEE